MDKKNQGQDFLEALFILTDTQFSEHKKFT